MSKILDKGGTEKPPIPTIKLPPGNQYQTRAATQAASTTRPASTQSGITSAQPKEVIENKGKAAENSKEKATGTSKQKITILQTVTEAIKVILGKEKPEKKVKSLLEDILKFISDAEAKEKGRTEGMVMQQEVSTLHIAIKQDLSKMHEALAKQINGIQCTANAALENSEKSLADTQNLMDATKEIASKVGKVNDAADKIASDTQSYRDVLT